MRAHTIITRRAARLLAGLLVLAAALAVAPPAGAYVYWTSEFGTIGRANLDGTGVNQSFITGAGISYDMAVNATHVYWASYASGTIGRANLDGSGVSQSFITVRHNVGVGGVAVGAGHVYWTTSAGAIGRANLDGSGVSQRFIPSRRGWPYGASGALAVGARHLYWSGGCDQKHRCRIGRARLDGTRVDRSFITISRPSAPGPDGVVVLGLAVGAGHLYWAAGALHDASVVGPRRIGRARLDGTRVDRSFIRRASKVAFDLAVGAGHLYWEGGSTATSTIARANLDGTGVDRTFISSGVGGVEGVAVDALPGKATAKQPQKQAGD